jgi:hypothetical protein
MVFFRQVYVVCAVLDLWSSWGRKEIFGIKCLDVDKDRNIYGVILS